MRLILTTFFYFIFHFALSQQECLERIRKEASEISARQELSGTGFFIESNLIVTNKHVVERADNINVLIEIDGKSRSVEAEILLINNRADIAILRINPADANSNQPYFYISPKELEIGEKIYVLGYPTPEILGGSIKLTDGIVNSKSGFLGDTSLYQISAAIQPGNSGSPLLNEKGEVKGIVVSSYTNGQLVNYAIKSRLITNLIDNYNRHAKNKIFLKKDTPVSIKKSIKAEVLKVCQIRCNRQKSYFSQFDINIRKKPKDWTFGLCDDQVLLEYCTKNIDKDNIPENIMDKALLYSYFYRLRQNASLQAHTGFGFFQILYDVNAYDNLIFLVDEDFPINKILSDEMDPLALEMYCRLVFPFYWRSYLNLYSRWDLNKIEIIYKYCIGLHQYLQIKQERHYLLDETYEALAHTVLEQEKESNIKLKKIVTDFDKDVLQGKIVEGRETILDEFRKYCK